MDESGELTKRYTQTKEEEEICGSARPVEFRTLSLEDPAAMDRGAEEEAAADPPGSEPRPPNADVEKQDWPFIVGGTLVMQVYLHFFVYQSMTQSRKHMCCWPSPWKLCWQSRPSCETSSQKLRTPGHFSIGRIGVQWSRNQIWINSICFHEWPLHHLI